MLVSFVFRTNNFKGISSSFISEDHSFNQAFAICVLISRNLYFLSGVIRIKKIKSLGMICAYPSGYNKQVLIQRKTFEST